METITKDSEAEWVLYMFKQGIQCVILFLAGAMIVGCSDGKTSVEHRRKISIQEIERDYLRDKHPVRSRMHSQVLDAVKSADARSLKNPKIAYCLLVGDKEQVFRLYLFWIEDSPSVDAYELSYSTESETIKVKLGDQDLNRLKKNAETMVDFAVQKSWDGNSNISKTLLKVQSTKNLKVRLLRSGAPATEWYRVDYNKLGEWVE